MRQKDYRELQISKSVLIFIFLGIIILGISIFLLGVSVGKKQAQIAQSVQSIPEETIENVETPQLKVEDSPAIEEEIVSIPVQKPDESISEEIASHEKIETQEKKLVPKPEPEIKNLYYIQAGAFKDKSNADDFLAKLRKLGFPASLVAPRPNERRQLFKVHAGGYKTREEAEKIKIAVEKAVKKTGFFIIRY